MKENNLGKNSGGTKKFLYTGPTRRGDQDLDDEWDFTGCSLQSKTSDNKVGNFDIDDVWSIKKNVTIPKNSPRSDSETVNLTSNKGFYSRHGTTVTGGPNVLASSENKKESENNTGKKWGQQSYSYSYASSDGGRNSQSPQTSTGAFRPNQQGTPRTEKNASGYNYSTNSKPF